MTKLADRVEYALNETRILVLVVQVLLGFQLQSVMQTGFERLTPVMRDLRLTSLCMMLLSFALLMAPVAYHSVVEQGEDTESVNRFTTIMAGVALLPFSLSFGIDIDVVVGKVAGDAAGVAAAAGAVCVALFFWYGIEFAARLRQHHQRGARTVSHRHDMDRPDGGTPLGEKIRQLLTEIRVVLPGAQALLGFQFAVMFVDGFDKLPPSSKYLHLISLAAVGLAAILLMTPAAYHRIVEEGEETPGFYALTNRILLLAMVVLAAGMSLDLFVIVRKITSSIGVAAAFAIVSLLFFYGLWFGFTLIARARRHMYAATAVQHRASAVR